MNYRGYEITQTPDGYRAERKDGHLRSQAGSDTLEGVKAMIDDGEAVLAAWDQRPPVRPVPLGRMVMLLLAGALWVAVSFGLAVVL